MAALFVTIALPGDFEINLFGVVASRAGQVRQVSVGMETILTFVLIVPLSAVWLLSRGAAR